MTEEPADSSETAVGNLRRQRRPETAVPCDDQPGVRPRAKNFGKRIDENVESLLRLEPADSADDELVGGNPELLPARWLAAPIAPKRRIVDPVENRHDAAGAGAAANELIPHIA